MLEHLYLQLCCNLISRHNLFSGLDCKRRVLFPCNTQNTTGRARSGIQPTLLLGCRIAYLATPLGTLDVPCANERPLTRVTPKRARGLHVYLRHAGDEGVPARGLEEYEAAADVEAERVRLPGCRVRGEGVVERVEGVLVVPLISAPFKCESAHLAYEGVLGVEGVDAVCGSVLRGGLRALLLFGPFGAVCGGTVGEGFFLGGGKVVCARDEKEVREGVGLGLS